MSVSKKLLVVEKQKLEQDFNALSEKLKQSELSMQGLRNNLNAIHGAMQQVDKLLGMFTDDKDEKEKSDGKVVQKT
jgi:hypothetical protein